MIDSQVLLTMTGPTPKHFRTHRGSREQGGKRDSLLGVWDARRHAQAGPDQRRLLAAYGDDLEDFTALVDSWVATLGRRLAIEDFGPFLAAVAGLGALRQYGKARKLQTLLTASASVENVPSRQVLGLSRALLEADLGAFQAAADVLKQPWMVQVKANKGSSWFLASRHFIEARLLERSGRLLEASDALWLGLRCSPAQGLAEPLLLAYEAALGLWQEPHRVPAIIEQLETHAATYPKRIQRSFYWMKRARSAALGSVTPADEQEIVKTAKSAELVWRRISEIAVLKASGAPRKALTNATDLIEEGGLLRPQDVVAINLVICQISLGEGSLSAATKYLGKALRAGAAVKLETPFIDHAVTVERVLAAATPAQLGLSRRSEIDFLSAIAALVNPRLTQDPLLPIEPLTPREVELLRLLEQGLTNKEIARMLKLKTSTVKWHFYKVFAKLGVSNRGGALVMARNIGL